MKVEYSATRTFDGNPGRAFEIASMVLLSNNFRIVSKSSSSMEFAGRGLVSSRENPLVGATRIFLVLRGGELAIEAELGGVKQLGRILYFLPLGIAVFFLILFGVFFADHGLIFTVSVSIAPLLPWVVLSPLLTRWFRSRTSRAIDELLENMAVAASAK